MATFSKHTDLANVGEIAAQVKILQKTIRELQDKAQDFNKKQMLFGEDVKNYKNVFDMSRCVLHVSASAWARFGVSGTSSAVMVSSACHVIQPQMNVRDVQPMHSARAT